LTVICQGLACEEEVFWGRLIEEAEYFCPTNAVLGCESKFSLRWHLIV